MGKSGVKLDVEVGRGRMTTERKGTNQGWECGEFLFVYFSFLFFLFLLEWGSFNSPKPRSICQ